MIFAALIDIAFIPLQFLLGFLPDMDIQVSVDVLSKFFGILDIVMFILPVQAVVPIIMLIIAINVFKIIIAVIRTTWKFMPFIGN